MSKTIAQIPLRENSPPFFFYRTSTFSDCKRNTFGIHMEKKCARVYTRLLNYFPLGSEIGK